MEERNLLTEATQDVVNKELELNEVADSNADSEVDEALEMLENDEDVIRLKAQEAELMNLFADPRIMKAYKRYTDARNGGERRKVTQKEKKKKKAKRRMAKKSRR